MNRGKLKMKKFKKVAVLCMSMVMALSTACSPSAPAKETAKTEGTEVSKKTEPAAGEKQKIVFWDKSEYIKEYNTIMAQKCKEFTEQTGIEVDYVIVPPNDIKQKIMAGIEAKNVPDLIVGDDALCAQFVTMDQIADVADLNAKLELTDTAKNIALLNNKEMLTPLAFLAPGMYWRKDVWEEKGLKEPITWEELKEQAKKVNDPKNGFYALGFPMGASGGGDAEGFMRSVINSFGGVVVDADGKVTVNSKETLEALKYVASLFEEGLVPPDAITWDDMGNNNAYLAGTVGVIFNSGSVWSALEKENPELLAKTQIIAYPAGPSGKTFVPGGSNVFATFKNGKNPEGAKQLAAFILNDKPAYQELVEAMNGMWQPVTAGSDETDFWKQPANVGWLANSKAVVRNFHPAPADEYAQQAFANQVCVKAMQKIIVNKMDPQKALDELEADVMAVYKDRK
jgi:ABC-type glycerol-3-phosphate transport system substrate-binding protein